MGGWGGGLGSGRGGWREGTRRSETETQSSGAKQTFGQHVESPKAETSTRATYRSPTPVTITIRAGRRGAEPSAGCSQYLGNIGRGKISGSARADHKSDQPIDIHTLRRNT